MDLMTAKKKLEELTNQAIAANKEGKYEEAISLLKQAGGICFSIAKAVPAEKELQMKRVDMYERQIAKIRETMKNPPKAKTTPSQTGKKDEEGKEGGDLKYTTNTGVTFDDVIGLETAKKVINTECISYFKYPEAFARFAHKPTKAILLYGVPGTGKTMFAKAVASEVQAPFIHISASDIKDKYVGESEKNILKIFDEIKQYKYAIVFLDEAEEILPVRGGDSNSSISGAMVTNFLKVIDGFDSGSNFLFIAATNIPSNIDPAILSRCRYKINITLPTEEARKLIIKKQLKEAPLGGDVTLDYIAKNTPKYSGRDLENLCGEITAGPVNRYIADIAKFGKDNVSLENYFINKEDVDRAINIVRSSFSPEAERQIKVYESSLPKNEKITDDDEDEKKTDKIIPQTTPKPIATPEEKKVEPKVEEKKPPFEEKKPPVKETAPKGQIKFNLAKVNDYQFPSIDLLKDYDDATINEELIQQMADKIKSTLNKFQLDVEVVDYTVAPQIIRFELRMPEGISVNKVSAYTNDLSMALSGVTVNFVQTIQGKDTFGIEVTNPYKKPISLKRLIDSEEFRQVSPNSLSTIIGIDTNNNVVIEKDGKICHALISGSTGNGKSVYINSVIISLLYKYTPNDLRMILIDPKRVEFSMYKRIPHLLCDVISDMELVNPCLDQLIDLMNDRYELLEREFYKDVVSYNEDHLDNKLPLITLFIDEFADIIVSGDSTDFVNKLISLSSKGRAAGIHIFIATQRPSADIIVSPIKTNFITRIAFKVPSSVDSRVILNEPGAENLCGRGDLIFKGASTSIRAQAPLVTDNEIRQIMMEICK